MTILSDPLPLAETLHWFKAQASNSGTGCVEIAHLPDGGVAVRHSQKPEAEVILYAAIEWDALLDAAKGGEFDRPVNSAGADRHDAGRGGVTHLRDGGVALCHGQRPDAEVILYNAFEWDCFLDGARRGEFDRPVVVAA